MIRSLSFTKATAIYHQVSDHSERGFVFAKQNTPVATLADPIIAPALFYDPNSEDYSSVASIAALLERNSVFKTGTDEYDLTLKNFTELVSDTIRRTVYLTKSVALPVIEDITTSAEVKLNEITGGEGLALSILPDTQSDMLENPTLISVMEPYVPVASGNYKTVNVHDPRDGKQLIEIMRVGYDSFDKDLQEWMGTHLSTDIVTDIYDRVFSTVGRSVPISTVFDGGADTYPEALICFLLCRGLSLNPDDNINMSASEYDKAMAMVSNYSAVTVKTAMQRHRTVDKLGRLVLRYPRLGEELSYDKPEQGVIVVNKRIYDRFLNEGGSPEVVMGSYLHDRVNDVETLLANRDTYIKYYNTRLLKVRSDNKLRVIITMRKHIELLIANEIVKSLPEVEDKGVWKGISLDHVVAQTHLRKCIDRLVLSDMDDMYSTVRDIVLKVFFNETDVPKLIELIDSNSQGEDTDIKSAVNVAIIDYIVDWFMHQIELSKN